MDTTIVRLQKELMKIDHFEYRNYMKQVIIIDEANRLVKNPYSLISHLLDFKNYRQNQLEDKNIKKLFKKFKNYDELNFLKITIITQKSKILLILHNLLAYENDPSFKIKIIKDYKNAIVTFTLNDKNGEYEFEKIEMANWQE